MKRTLVGMLSATMIGLLLSSGLALAQGVDFTLIAGNIAGFAQTSRMGQQQFHIFPQLWKATVGGKSVPVRLLHLALVHLDGGQADRLNEKMLILEKRQKELKEFLETAKEPEPLLHR